MRLGLRRGDKLTTTQGLFAALVRARLVSEWSHSAIELGGVVYQAQPFKGVHACLLTNVHGYKWFDIGGNDELALLLFWRAKGAPYDWFSLLAFILPWRITSSKMYYCHELCLYMMGGRIKGRVTVETLFKEALTWKL